MAKSGSKKTLYILLIAPFIVSLLSFALIKQRIRELPNDIQKIDFDGIFDEYTGFQMLNEMNDNPYTELRCNLTYDRSRELASDNELIWFINGDTTIAEVVEKEEEKWYLFAKNEGTVTVGCRNKKGTASATFNAEIYNEGTIIINFEYPSSSESITGKRYFGQYDLVYTDPSSYRKNNANINLKVKTLPEGLPLKVKNITSTTLNYDEKNSALTIKNSGEAKISFSAQLTNEIELKKDLDLNIVKDGCNVYSYNDLLAITNKNRGSGEIGVLQVNLESLENTYVYNNGNRTDELKNKSTRLFGNLNKNSFSFNNEVYRFKTTYNDKFIKQIYGENTNKNEVISGIHIQKDFYGNGFTVNGRNLTYPINGSINQYTGILTPDSTKGDLFTGPLTFVSIGDFEAPIVKAFGQDNSLIYIDKEGVTVNDLNVINCDNYANNIYNLEFVGTGIDVNAKDVTLKNVTVKNTRNAVRVYSSDNFLLENSLLQNSREFLLKIGCNEYKETDLRQYVNYSFDGETFDGRLGDFLDKKEGISADSLIFNEFIQGQGDSEETISMLNTFQSQLDNPYLKGDEVDFGQEITVKDTYFNQSGIFAIAFDTYFNGCFLYNGMPSYIKATFNRFGLDFALPNNVGATMRPSKLNLVGDTKFYDFKDIEDLDASCLIEERIGEFAKSVLGDDFEMDRIPIDYYFPMKKLVSSLAADKKYIYKEEGKSYLNSEVAYYGGGINLSTVDSSSLNNIDFGEDLHVNIMENSMNGNSGNRYIDILQKCVSVAAGFNAFNFITNGTYTDKPYLYKESPSREDLIVRGRS